MLNYCLFSVYDILAAGTHWGSCPYAVTPALDFKEVISHYQHNWKLNLSKACNVESRGSEHPA